MYRSTGRAGKPDRALDARQRRRPGGADGAREVALEWLAAVGADRIGNRVPPRLAERADEGIRFGGADGPLAEQAFRREKPPLHSPEDAGGLSPGRHGRLPA
jgi:hypothetical protein